jgi:c-di-GMP-related signal transduction protein
VRSLESEPGKVQERKRAKVQERKRNSRKVVVFNASENVLRGIPGPLIYTDGHPGIPPSLAFLHFYYMADLPSNENLRFLARQPILTAKTLIFAYEILSRHGPENYFRPVPGGAPDMKAMDDLFLMGLKQMTNGLPAFLNCTRGFLLKDYLELMPRDMIVGEILEDVTPDAEVLAACLRIKKRGYRLALDDYEDRPELAPLVALADYVKIDFLTTNLPEQERLGKKFAKLRIKLIAEKVETHEQFLRGREMGYEYFQGYFFVARRWCRDATFRKINWPTYSCFARPLRRNLI